MSKAIPGNYAAGVSMTFALYTLKATEFIGNPKHNVHAVSGKTISMFAFCVLALCRHHSMKFCPAPESCALLEQSFEASAVRPGIPASGRCQSTH